MFQDNYLPKASISNSHCITINATSETIFPLVNELDFSRSRLIYWLFRLRGIPVRDSLSLKGLERLHFVRLETVEKRGVIIGLIGQFWTPSGRLKNFQPEEFINSHPEYAKATWSFELIPLNRSTTKLVTETRIYCPTARMQLQFRYYWTLIRPFSSLIRLEILKAVKREAEAQILPE